MNTSVEREKLLKEVYRLPEEKLAEVYTFVHYFRIGLETAYVTSPDVMNYAGCWRDMPEETFTEFVRDVEARRRYAFARRRN